MTKKRVSLLFMLMLCNVASVRADFGFFKGLFGLFKSMQTMFSSREDYYNPIDRANNIGPQLKNSEGLFERGLRWFKSNFGFITSENVEKLRTEVNDIEERINTHAQRNSHEFNQLEDRLKSVQEEGDKTKGSFDELCKKLNFAHKNYSEKKKEIKKHIEEDASFKETIQKNCNEANKKIRKDNQYFKGKIVRIKEQKETLDNQFNGENGLISRFEGFEKTLNESDRQQEANVKQIEEKLTAADLKANTLYQSVQMLTQDFYQAKQNLQRNLLEYLTNLSVEEFKRLKDLNFKDSNHNGLFKELLNKQKAPYQISSKEASQLEICKKNDVQVMAMMMIKMANVVHGHYMKTKILTNHFNPNDDPD